MNQTTLLFGCIVLVFLYNMIASYFFQKKLKTTAKDSKDAYVAISSLLPLDINHLEDRDNSLELKVISMEDGLKKCVEQTSLNTYKHQEFIKKWEGFLFWQQRQENQKIRPLYKIGVASRKDDSSTAIITQITPLLDKNGIIDSFYVSGTYQNGHLFQLKETILANDYTPNNE